jgi:hypothetical protein
VFRHLCGSLRVHQSVTALTHSPLHGYTFTLHHFVQASSLHSVTVVRHHGRKQPFMITQQYK